MSFTDRYVQGSFRGLKFFTERAQVQAGQRRAIFEIPFDDAGAASIDLGRAPRKFSLSVFLLEQQVTQNELDLDVRAFLAALEAPGPGLLVHPYLGRVMVLPDANISIDFDHAELGKATINFQATESRARTAQAPQAQPNTKAQLPKATAALRVANREAFSSRFNVSAIADFVRDANTNTLLTVLQNLRRVNGTISSVLAVPGELASQIDAISLQVVSLLDTPDKLYDTLSSVIDVVYLSITRVASRFGVDVSPDAPDAARPDAPALAVRGLKLAIQSAALTAGSPPAGERDTPPRAQERENRAAIDQGMNAAALAAIIDAANELSLPSKQDNETARDMLLDALESLFLQDLEAAVADALSDVRAAVWTRFSGAGAALLTVFTPRDDMPADVIAFQLYGDAERADEIVTRNEIADPGQCPGLIDLEVLSR